MGNRLKVCPAARFRMAVSIVTYTLVIYGVLRSGNVPKYRENPQSSSDHYFSPSCSAILLRRLFPRD